MQVNYSKIVFVDCIKMERAKMDFTCKLLLSEEEENEIKRAK